jgi:hypothetical protein
MAVKAVVIASGNKQDARDMPRIIHKGALHHSGYSHQTLSLKEPRPNVTLEAFRAN